MAWVIAKQNTSIKISNAATNALFLTNLQLFLQKIDNTSFYIYHAAGPTSAITIKTADITSIGGNAPSGTISAIFDQIAALLP